MKKKQQPLEKQLKSINSILNNFLKHHFRLELDSLQQYLHNVKDLLIQLTTLPTAPILTNVFSKFSNILQPFTSYSYDLSLDSLKHEVNLLRENNNKLERKVKNLRGTLEQYRIKSNRMTEFIYMLKKSKIDMDDLYRTMTQSTKMNNGDQTQIEYLRRGLQLQKQEQLLISLQMADSNLTSQYVSVRQKR